MGSPTCPTCGKDADFVETFHGARSCYHPFHATPTPPAPADDAGGERRASIDALRRIARAAKPFSFYTRSLSENPGEYVMRVPRDEADEIQRAVDAIWGTDDYATPLPARRESASEDAVVEARDRVFHTAGTAKVLRTVYEIGMEARMYCVDADREAALRDVQDAEDAMDRAVIDYSKALAALRGTRPEGHSPASGQGGE